MSGTETTEIAIIGAGPIGSYTASRLAKLGNDVIVLEEHPETGRPEQCAGLVNHAMFDLPGLEKVKDIVKLHDITGSDIYSPRGNVLRLRAKKVKAISMDRALFDKVMVRNAVREGARLRLSTKVVGIKAKNV